MVNVFLLGDSINLDYGQFVPAFLKSGIHVYGKPGAEEAYENLDIPIGGNGGDSRMVLEYLQTAEGPVLDCDYFIFNCGLHDLKHNAKTGLLQVPLEEYEQNLQAIVELMQNRGVKVVFINTTPTDQTRYSAIKSFYRLTEDVPAYNQAAQAVMTRNQVPVIDLYGFTQALGLSGDDLFRDHTHFTPAVIKLHSAFIAGFINGFAETKKEETL